MKYLRYIVVLLMAVLLAAGPDFDLSAAPRRSHTTTSRASRGKKKSTTTRGKRSSRTSRVSRSSSRHGSRSHRGSRSRRSRYSRPSRARAWAPFRTFETAATPTPYYVASDSIASLRVKAADGNREAAYLLGCAYFEKRVRDVARDSSIYYAARYWKQAADLGHATAMGDYAYCLRTGRGVAADTLAAVDNYVRSLVKGNNRLLKLTRQNAAHGSGFDAYIMSLAVTERPELAAPGMTVAAYDDIAVNSSFTQAVVERAIAAIDKGDTASAIELLRPAAPRLRSGAVGRLMQAMKQRDIDNLDLLTVLAESDNPDAQYALGHELATRGRADEAARWMHRAATGGSDEALVAYIGDLINGKGIKRDYYQAYMWLDVLAGEHGSDVIGEATRLGVDSVFTTFARGLAAVRSLDYATGLKYFTSIEAVSPEAQSMKLLCQSRTDKKSKAIKQLKQAVKQNRPLAAYAYALLYTRDARKIIKPAADAGDVAAAEQLAFIMHAKKEWADAFAILDRLDESAILSPEGAKALAECIEALKATDPQK